MSTARSVTTAVVDTNLVISAFVAPRGTPSRVIDALYTGIFRGVDSPSLLIEYGTVLQRPQFQHRYGITPNDIVDFIEFLRRTAFMVTPLTGDDMPLLVRDSKDNHVLATALAGEADHLVTGDNDLLVLAGNPLLRRLQIVNSRAFLDIIE